jgi:hypothetical protein
MQNHHDENTSCVVQLRSVVGVVTDSKEEIAKSWICDNLEEAQQLIDNIVGIKGITEDPLKVAAELEGSVKLTPHTDTTNVSVSYGWNVIAVNTAGTLQKVVVAHPPHEELYGY